MSDLGARFRTVSPAFYIGLTEGNLIGAPAGSYVAAADGFYPVLPPLVPGEHTLDFGGTTGKFSVDVRYDALTNNE